jgi:hypothetical protein
VDYSRMLGFSVPPVGMSEAMRRAQVEDLGDGYAATVTFEDAEQDQRAASISPVWGSVP